MDHHEVSHRAEKGHRRLLLRCSFALIFSFIASFFLFFVGGFFAISVGNFSISSPISVPAQCKIVSSSVDLRSSKVEYKEHSSGQTRWALAEAPNEALPLYCRPNFGAAWLTKDHFRVNETYNCRYTPGISKVNINYDSLFKCRAKDPSMIEMIKRYFTLSIKILRSWSTSQKKAKLLYWETLAGIITGALTSLVTISLVRILHGMKSRLYKIWQARTLQIVVLRNPFYRVCFLVAYVSITCWFTVYYWRLLGLPKIFASS